jgi:hypothetical protein
MNEARFEIDDVRRHLHFGAIYIEKFISRSIPDDELDEYLLDLVGGALKNCEHRLEALLDKGKLK